MLKIKFDLKTTTKTCFRFESRNEDGSFTTLYLKKAHIDAAGINPAEGITVTVEQAKEEVQI